MRFLGRLRQEEEDPGATLDDLREAVTTLEETLRTARRVLGGGHPMTGSIARELQSALSRLREAVRTLAETERTTRRLLGSAHPVTAGIEVELRDARAALAAKETPSPRGPAAPALAVDDGLDADVDEVLAS